MFHSGVKKILPFIELIHIKYTSNWKTASQESIIFNHNEKKYQLELFRGSLWTLSMILFSLMLEMWVFRLSGRNILKTFKDWNSDEVILIKWKKKSWDHFIGIQWNLFCLRRKYSEPRIRELLATPKVNGLDYSKKPPQEFKHHFGI